MSMPRRQLRKHPAVVYLSKLANCRVGASKIQRWPHPVFLDILPALKNGACRTPGQFHGFRSRNP